MIKFGREVDYETNNTISVFLWQSPTKELDVDLRRC